MKRLMNIRFQIFVITTFLLTACGGGSSDSGASSDLAPTLQPMNIPPTANSGQNQTVGEGTSVELSGSGSDNDGTIVSYQWTQLSGPSVSIVGSSEANASFIAPEVTDTISLSFELIVTDNEGAHATDTLEVTIINVNKTPTVNAGEDITVDEQSSVNLSLTASDEDGTIETIAWAQTSGINVVLSSTSDENVSFEAPEVFEEQVVEFSATVTDNEGASSVDMVTVTILNSAVKPTKEVTLFIVGDGEIAIDGEVNAQCGLDKICIFTIPDGSDKTITATPSAGYIFNGWENCSNPKGNVCKVDYDGKEIVSASFAQEEFKLKDNVIELTDAQIDWLIDYTVGIDELKFDAQAMLPAITVGNILIANRYTDSNDTTIVFAYRVVEVNNDTDNNALIRVVEASIDEVIAIGSGSQFAIQQNLAKQPVRLNSLTAFDNDGNPYEVDLKLIKRRDMTQTDSLDVPLILPNEFVVSLELEDGVKLSGTLGYGVDITTDFDLGLTGVKEFLLYTTTTLDLAVTLNVEAELKKEFRNIPSIFIARFGCVPFAPGFCVSPGLSVKPEVEVGVKAATSITAGVENEVISGIHYVKGHGFNPIFSLDSDPYWNWSPTSVGYYAESGLYLEKDLLINFLAGPTISIGPYVAAKVDVFPEKECKADAYGLLGFKATIGGQVSLINKRLEAELIDKNWRYDITENCDGVNDPTAPSAPTILALVDRFPDIDITWSASEDEETTVSYNVYNNVGVLVSDALVSTSTTTTVRFDNADYCYYVEAINSVSLSSKSNTECISIGDYANNQLPPPTNLAFTSLGDGRIQLSWNESSSPDADYFVLYEQNTDVGELVGIASIDGYSTTVTPNRNAEVCYAVAAFDVFDNASEISNTVCVESTTASTNRGLVAFYPFDGNGNDSTRNAFDGVATASVSYDTGISGQAAKLNGSDAYFVVDDHPKLRLARFTLSAWVKWESDEACCGGGGIVSKTANNNEWDSYALTAHENYFRSFINYDTDNDELRHTTSALADGGWHHVAATYDGDKRELFLDGVLVEENAYNEEIAYPSAGDLYIGIDLPGGNDAFEGLLDEVRIYSRALSEIEITKLYESHGDIAARPPSQDGFNYKGNTWRRLDQTIGDYSWNQIAQVCDQATGECIGSINGISLNGWIWATKEEVYEMLEVASELPKNSLSDGFEILPWNSNHATEAIEKFGANLVERNRQYLYGFTRSRTNLDGTIRGVTVDLLDCLNSSCNTRQVAEDQFTTGGITLNKVTPGRSIFLYRSID